MRIGKRFLDAEIERVLPENPNLAWLCSHMCQSNPASVTPIGIKIK